MRRERIRAVPRWRRKFPRYDCVLVETDSTQQGMLGLHVARVKLFFSTQLDEITYPCALVEWYSRVSDHPDEDTGMWIVKPELHDDGSPVQDVIHLDTILRLVHLLPSFGDSWIPPKFESAYSLDVFKAFFVNKYADYNAHEMVF